MPFQRNDFIQALPFFRNPFFYFFLFLLMNILLSCPGVPVIWKLWIGSLGIGLPLVLAFFAMEKETGGKSPILLNGDPVFIPAAAWLVLAFLAIGTRFYRLSDLSSWPTRDDGNYAFAAMELNRNTSLPFFYGIGEHPPFFLHLLAVFMKWSEPSVYTAWLFPTLISLLTVPLGYWAVRSFSSKAFSFVYALLLASSFWPVLLGRFCVAWVLALFWEFMALGTLVRFFKASSLPKRRLWAVVLGAVMAFGFYISWVLWLFVTVAMTLAAAGIFLSRGKRDGKEIFFFLLTATVVFIPFTVEALVQGIGRHAHEVWLGNSFDGLHQLLLCGRYLAGFFWFGDSAGYNYGPVEGGFLNPLLSTFFFAGIVWLSRLRHLPTVKWMGLAGLLFLVPGFLTHDVEMQRLMLVLPLLLLIMVMGLLWVLSGLTQRWMALSLALLLGFSAGWDFYRLVVPLREALNPPWHSQTLKSEESFNAYGILKEKADKDGPGWLFLDYVPVPLDQTLLLATYPFNAAYNPKLESVEPRWMAFLANVNYGPFLEKRFPDGQWHILGSSLMPWDGELMLGVVPLTPQSRGTAEAWMKAQPIFHGATVGIVRQSEGKSREGVLEDFFKGYPLVQGDPFLESAFWEIAYFNHSADKRFQDSFSDLTRILRDGYPAAHIFNELGTLLWFKKDYPDARKAFLRAARLGGNHTLAMENLRQLESDLKN